MEDKSVTLYNFWKANIHEHRVAARMSRLAPLMWIMFLVCIILLGVLWNHLVLLLMTALLNVCQWLWISTTAIFGMVGAIRTSYRLEKDNHARHGENSVQNSQDIEHTDQVLHMIVLPNYEEDQAMMAETLQALSEAEEHALFCVVLAMEEKEGQQAIEKLENLRRMFAPCFLSLIGTFHPPNLEVTHLDGSQNPEVPGKASNVAWAVKKGWEVLEQDGKLSSQKSTILTIADADCLFHPGYFSHISRDFNILREQPGDQHLWSMWQAPQLNFRDFFQLPICSRIWSYASSTYEFGGVSGLDCGGHHMVFSSYSLPLCLAVEAEAWDGDSICEDHHAYLKCFFYNCHVSATAALESKRGMGIKCKPMLQVRPIYLPVKSTSVISPEGYWATWVARWHQAKRHANGVAELCFAILGCWDTLTSIPWRVQSFHLFFSMLQVVMRLWCMHMLPVSQALGLGALTISWFAHGRNIPMCPSEIWWANLTFIDNVICGLAGAWVLVWPVVIPMLFVSIANFMFLDTCFLRSNKPSREPESIWDSADVGEPGICCCIPMRRNARLATLLVVCFDCFFCFSPLMTVYGFLVELMAYFTVAIYGNGVKYVTAAKVSSAQIRSDGAASYGTMDHPEGYIPEKGAPIFTGPGMASSSRSRFSRPAQEVDDPFLTGEPRG